MKKIFLLLFCFLVTGLFADGHISTIREINFYGQDWPNGHRGGILFSMDEMPPGINFFQINSGDIALKHFVSVLLLGYSSDFKIQVSYDPKLTNQSKYCPIVHLKLPNK